MARVGLISDTHGLLRPEALAFLRGSDYIVHAGDIGDAKVLEQLRALAPVTAVRGNNDKGPWADAIAETDVLHVGDVHIYVLHDLAKLDVDPVNAGFQVVVSGHSHQPLVEERDGVLYVNPGSSGPRRFKLPVALGELHVTAGSVKARLLRQACRDDISAMHRVRMAVRENRLTSTAITESDYIAAVEDHGCGWVIETDGNVVGFAVADARDGNIWALFVDPDHEGRGHGRRLHDTMIAWLRSRGLQRLWLTTDSNTRAQRFYEAAGWQHAGRTTTGALRLELRLS